MISVSFEPMRVRRTFLWNSTSLSTDLLKHANHTFFIETLILTALTSLGFGAPALNILVPAFTALVTTAVTLGISWLLMPKPPKPDDGKFPKVQGIPPRIYAVGTNRIGGYYMLWEEKNTVLFGVQALVGHPCSALVQYYLHDDPVTLKENGYVADLENERYGNNKIRLWHRLGAVPETPYDVLVTNLGADGVWTNDCRGDGQTSLAAAYIGASQKNFPKYYPYGAPQPSAALDCALVWDPRDDAQDPDDQSTWVFSKNSALIMMWHQCFNPFGPQEDYRTAILPVLDIWKEEADICDEMIPRATGGFERRYECNGWATTETDLIAVQNSILATCDGWLLRPGDGTLVLRVGKFRPELVVKLTDADIVGRTIEYDIPEEEAINRLVPKFTYPATDYSTTDTDFFEDVDQQLKDGRLLTAEADYAWVQQWRQARRLGKREWLRQKQRLRGSLDVRMSGIRAAYSRWIHLSTPIGLPHLDGMIIENRRAVISLARGGYQIDFTKHPEDIEEWDPEVDEGLPPPVPVKPTGSGLPSPSLDSIFVVASGGSVFLRVNIFDPGTDEFDPGVRWRIKDIGGGTPGAWNQLFFPDPTVEGGLIALTTGAVPAEQLLQVQIAFRSARGTVSTWVPATAVEVFTTVDSTAPGVVTGVGAAGGAGQAALTWISPNSPNYVGARVYRNTSNNLGTASLVRTEYGPPSSADGWTDTGLSAGTYYYWIRSINGSGIEATAVATGAVSVT